MNSLALDFPSFLNRYFEGLPDLVRHAKPGKFTLVTLLNFHLKKYPFSSLHANANDTPNLDCLSLISRLVDAEAGYCFHHSVAFFEAMKNQQFKDIFFVAGTFPGNDLPTHIAIVWKKEDDDWYLVDPGSGYAISYPIPFDPSKKNPGPYRIQKTGDSYILEKFSQKANAYEPIYTFSTQPLLLESDTFQKGVDILTTPKHVFYNNFWHFGLDRTNRTWNVILTVKDQSATDLLLIDGKKQDLPNPLSFINSKINAHFHALLTGNQFTNEHLHQAIIDRLPQPPSDDF